MKSIVLILSHSGKSFINEWAVALKELGIDGFVLSSRLETDYESWKKSIPSVIIGTCIINSKSLRYEDVNLKTQELLKNFDRVVVVTVWELYRQYAALENERLGNPDTTERQIFFLRDKFSLRNKLKEKGLSRKCAEILSEQSFFRAKIKNEDKFIKPRFGIASHTAFKLDPNTKWNELKDLSKSLVKDPDYGMYFFADSSLIIEDYILGTEFSLEVLVGGGDIAILAAHEKVEVEYQSKITLESACISPPTSNLIKQNHDKFQSWILKIFKTLDINEGLFHVEVKGHEKEWEVIEINPRLGGSLIFQSTLLVSNGVSLLLKAIELAFERDESRRRSIIKNLKDHCLESQLISESQKKTFFRVFFAETGRVIKNIVINNDKDFSPVISKCFLDTGLIKAVNREVFLGQALWDINSSNRNINDYLEMSRNHIRVDYLDAENSQSENKARKISEEKQ